MLYSSSSSSCDGCVLLKVAYKLNVAFLQDNFVRFFRLARKLPPLARCVVLPMVDHVRWCVCVAQLVGWQAYLVWVHFGGTGCVGGTRRQCILCLPLGEACTL